MAVAPSYSISFLSLLRPFYEFIFPPVCFACDALMERKGSKVCLSCWDSLRSVAPTDPIYLLAVDRLMIQGDLDGLTSLWHFEKGGTLQSIVHALKYDGMTSLGVELGRKLGERLRAEIPIEKYDGVIPVPLHRAKCRERGYNQSDFIGKGIQEVTGLPVLQNVLHRERFTKSQTELNAAERKMNVSGAFDLHKGFDVSGRSLVLVDDVITTGATIEACAATLKRHDARNILAASVALAV